MSAQLRLGMTGLLLATAAWACSSNDSGATASSSTAAATSGSGAGGEQSEALPSYIVPGDEAMAAIAIDNSSGELFVDSAESGKIYHGVAGANTETTLELFADLTSAGVSRGGHIALAPDGKTLLMTAALGDSAHIDVIDRATKTLTTRVTIPSNGAGAPVLLQDVAISTDGKTAYITELLENVIHTVDLSTFAVSSFPISSEFPHISDASQGFLNATGVSATSDGKSLLVVHLIDKHIYRVSIEPATLGNAQKIDTAPYNVSGNGLWLDSDGQALEVGGDELRVYRFSFDASYTTGTLQTKYQSPEFEQGLSYAVSHGDRILVLNGSGVSQGAGGFPGGGGGGGAGAGGGLPTSGSGFGSGSSGSGTSGTKVLPIKVLQLHR